ncbi:hypothetical protein M5689_003700 [Euphorbia peplus]|nr:hypothetical protein M5689_003700 [Euphorbia peplus]
METLVVVAQHRNQYYGKIKAYKPARYGSSPSGFFREINCRTFQSGAGILPTPYAADCSTPVNKSSPKTAAYSSPSSQKTPIKTQAFRSSPISINIPVKGTHFDDELGEDSLFSELWAGPAYSNSPPPSSLPIPKFSMRPKRTVSLDLPVSDSDVKVHPIAKSAPASPTREYSPSASTRDLFHGVDSATRMLRRILNLDEGDEEI